MKIKNDLVSLGFISLQCISPMNYSQSGGDALNKNGVVLFFFQVQVRFASVAQRFA
jgi:hypothetical protein